MAFGRSNSLSLNTGATNSLFSQQNAAQNNVPSMAGSLFGGPAAQQQQQQQSSQGPQSGSLFGDSTLQGSNTGAGGSLFGSTLNPTVSSGGGLFGGAAGQQMNQGQQSGGPFGSSAAQPAQSGGVFGSGAPQATQSGSLFGGSTAQPSQSGGLFGSSTAQPQSTGLFGSSTAQNQVQQPTGLFGGALSQPQQSGGFGSTGFNPQPSGGLFGSTATQPQQQGGGFFGSSTMAPSNISGNWGNPSQAQTMQGNPYLSSQNQPQMQGSNSVFGLNAVPVSQLNQPSLLGVSQYRQSQFAGPFQGKLTMGQGGVAPNTQTVGAVKVDLENLRPTTRFADCIDVVKETFEACDKMIRKQEEFCAQITAMLQHHSEAISTLAPDVSLVTEKADAAEQVLAMDAQGVEEQRLIATKDREDFERCARLVAQHRLPPAYQSNGPYGALYGTRGSSIATNSLGAEEADKDLIGNYFMPLAGELQRTLTAYQSNLTEIESHMRVIESSTITQAQQLAAKRDGVANTNGHASGENTVRELADTLRGFEHSILGVAGVVGQCAEGANELILGRLANSAGAGEGMRRM